MSLYKWETQSAHHPSKHPYQSHQNLLENSRQLAESRVAKLSSPIRKHTSPQSVREYLSNLKQFIQHYEAPKDSVQQKTNVNASVYLYWNYSSRLNQFVKLVSSQKVELTKLNADGSIHSLRYFYLKQPALSNIIDLKQSSSMTVTGGVRSGKKQIFRELLYQYSKDWLLRVQANGSEETVQVHQDSRTQIKGIMSRLKGKDVVLIAENGHNRILCQSLKQKPVGMTIVSIQPTKQNSEVCRDTLKFIEIQ